MRFSAGTTGLQAETARGISFSLDLPAALLEHLIDMLSFVSELVPPSFRGFSTLLGTHSGSNAKLLTVEIPRVSGFTFAGPLHLFTAM